MNSYVESKRGMGDGVYITFRATERTRDCDRRYDGETFPVPPGQQLLPAPGTRGTIIGIPGVMRAGLVWEMEDLPPEPPDRGPRWAQELSRKLDEIMALLERP